MNEEDFTLFARAYSGEALLPGERNEIYRALSTNLKAHHNSDRISISKTFLDDGAWLLTLEQRVFLKLTS